MKIILSPAKKMIVDTDNLAPVELPVYIDKTAEVLNWMKSKSKEELKAIWKCNDKIAEQNFNRLENMDLYNRLTPAVLAYEGIAFQYMAPSVFEIQQFEYLQNHLRILSAFYGILKPMDGVTPYRLEMQAKVGIGDAKNLYEYWGELLYRSVIDDSRIIISGNGQSLSLRESSFCAFPSVRIQTRNPSRQVSGKRDSCQPMLFYIRFLSIRPLSPVDRRCRGYCDSCVREWRKENAR